MTDLANTLAELSAKASGGQWHHQSGGVTGLPWISTDNWAREDGTYVRGGCVLNMVAHDERQQDAAFITALVNAYRTGKLVVVDNGAVERMAELQLAAFLAGRGSVTSMMHGTRAAKPGPTMDDYRRMSLAALKGTDHAG